MKALSAVLLLLAVAINAQAPAPAASAEKCPEGKLWSVEFKQCLPAPGTDGFLADQTKPAKIVEEPSIVGSESMLVREPVTLVQEQPLANIPQALKREEEIVQPVVAHIPQAAPRQALSGCPYGFRFSERLEACVPLGEDFAPHRTHRFRRPHMFHAHRMRNQDIEMPQIFAPVFVFVVPPKSGRLPRENATLDIAKAAPVPPIAQPALPSQPLAPPSLPPLPPASPLPAPLRRSQFVYPFQQFAQVRPLRVMQPTVIPMHHLQPTQHFQPMQQQQLQPLIEPMEAAAPIETIDALEPTRYRVVEPYSTAAVQSPMLTEKAKFIAPLQELQK